MTSILNSYKNYTRSLAIIRTCAFLIFIGRAYQYIFFDAPFRVLLWNEDFIKPIVEQLFNKSWDSYATSVTVDKYITLLIECNGVLFLIASFSSLFVTKKNFRFLKIPIVLGGLSLFFLALLNLNDHFFQWAQLFELSIQVGVPFLLLYAIKKEDVFSVKRIIKILIVTTFLAHGLYAIGVYPVPGHFVDMVINCLGFSEDNALLFLKIAGFLDILLIPLIFLPQTSKYALIYVFIWGVSTALARTISNFNSSFILHSFDQLTYKTVFRIPNGLIALSILTQKIKK